MHRHCYKLSCRAAYASMNESLLFLCSYFCSKESQEFCERSLLTYSIVSLCFTMVMIGKELVRQRCQVSVQFSKFWCMITNKFLVWGRSCAPPKEHQCAGLHGWEHGCKCSMWYTRSAPTQFTLTAYIVQERQRVRQSTCTLKSVYMVMNTEHTSNQWSLSLINSLPLFLCSTCRLLTAAVCHGPIGLAD